MRFLLFSIPIVNPFSNGSQFNRDRGGEREEGGKKKREHYFEQTQRIEPCYFNLIFQVKSLPNAPFETVYSLNNNKIHGITPKKKLKQ